MPQDNLLPPTDILDLSDLHAQSEWMVVQRALLGGGSSDHVAHTLQVNCVRLLDAAIRDYSFGRQLILDFHARPSEQFGIDYIVTASTHFESCIWHFERFIKHARALRSLKSAESALKAIIPRNLSFLQSSAESRITKLRHTLAHLEGAAQRGELPRGASIVLLPQEKGLTISGHVVEWEELVQWLRDAHACVVRLARFKPQADQNGTTLRSSGTRRKR